MRLSTIVVLVAAAFAGYALAADPPKPLTPEQWAIERQGAIVVEACTAVWDTSSEGDLDVLQAALSLQGANTEAALGKKMEEVRLKSIDSDLEYNKFHEAWTKTQGTEAQVLAYQRAEVAKLIATTLKGQWDRLFYMADRILSTKALIEKCVKDQRAYLRGEDDKPGTLYPPIILGKDVQGVWRVSCDDTAGGDPKIYAGAFTFTIEPGDIGGNKLKGMIKGAPGGDIELNGYLSTENSSFGADSLNPTLSAKNAFHFFGRVDGREKESPEATGTITGVANGTYSCSGTFSRHGDSPTP